MNTTIFSSALFIVVLLGVQHQVMARPNLISRVKRVSDAHFANVQTKHALNRAKGIVITLPIAAGVRDLDLIGRKRRSESRLLETLLNQSEEDQGDIRDDRIETNNYPDLLFDYK
ncbi:uncharacterized protein LOC109535548 [Dendroctonus ponderosae]|uniref:Uncharacterized protein n=1 Tax=Dendroctonus ponderosae TaxID=77166 RepID=A0AAR5P7E9_DENPD|nr:uncharacterized protein LOC109535548 [Dendroctonus ponderosae]